MKDYLLVVIAQLTRLTNALAALALVVIVALTTLEVILRYIFQTSTLLADEYSLYLFMAVLYLGAGYTLRTKRHIKVDIFTRHLSGTPKAALVRLVAVLNLPLFAVLSWRGWNIAIDAYKSDLLASTNMATPLYLPMLVIPIGFTVLALQALADVIIEFSDAKSRILNGEAGATHG